MTLNGDKVYISLIHTVRCPMDTWGGGSDKTMPVVAERGSGHMTRNRDPFARTSSKGERQAIRNVHASVGAVLEACCNVLLW